MLKECANPLCPNAFRVLSQGKLFQMEVDDFVACTNRKNRSPRRVERYWLCDRCCSSLTLIFEKGRGMVPLPLPSPNTPLTIVPLGTMRAAPQPHPVRVPPDPIHGAGGLSYKPTHGEH